MKNKRKGKIFAVIVIFFVISSFYGCSKTIGNTPNIQNSSTSTTTPTTIKTSEVSPSITQTPIPKEGNLVLTSTPTHFIEEELILKQEEISVPILTTVPKLREEEITPYQETPSIERLLRLAKKPLGSTMYIWGGGWNEEDTGAGIEARTLGISPLWAEFAAKQNADYNYNDTRFQIHNGLDCSGYIGWLIYNLLETEDGEPGYVMKAGEMASRFASQGFGEYTPATQVADWQAGDIMSMNGHVWMALGMCEDGSVVLIHSSPPGVILSGTKLPDDGESIATQLAEYYMKTYYPEWYKRYPNTSRSHDYLKKSHRMRWHREVLSDEENLCLATAEDILSWLFDEKK